MQPRTEGARILAGNTAFPAPCDGRGSLKTVPFLPLLNEGNSEINKEVLMNSQIKSKLELNIV